MEVPIDKTLQAVAVRANIGRFVTGCNVYISRSQEMSHETLTALFRQLPQPAIIMEDFNSYHEMWGCERAEPRERLIEEIIADSNFTILNSGAMTHIAYGTETVIDLTMCTAELAPVLDWTGL